MKKKIIVLFATCLIIICGFKFLIKTEAQSQPTVISGKFYKLETITNKQADNFVSIDDQVSINDTGSIAFSGKKTGSPLEVEQVFIRKVNGLLAAVTDQTVPVELREIGSVQINNSDQILSQIETRDDAQVPALVYELRRWDGNAVESSQLLANAFLRSTNRPAGYDFLRIFPLASMNNDGTAAFAASEPIGDPKFVSGIRPNFGKSAGSNDIGSSAQMMIADNGNVVARASDNTSPIRLYTDNMNSFTDIATISSITFSSLGKSPGISDDGEVVAFYGVLTAEGAQTLKTTQGPVETAKGISIVDLVPDALQFVSMTTTNGECDETEGSILCHLDSLGVGSSMTVVITATPLTAARVVNTVNVENGIGDLNLANNTATAAAVAINPSVPRADYDGDGISDIVVWRPSDGTWYILRNTDGTVIYQQFGTNGDKLVPTDYDGDGFTDFAVYRPSSAEWWILRSSNGSLSTLTFGLSNDKPVPGDYDGDGEADIAVFRPSDATWYIWESTYGNIRYQSFGLAGDRPVQADYDGDGLTDLAVYRPEQTVSSWWIMKITDNSVINTSFGANTDKPVPGDYDGDGRTDLGVWRPSEGKWYTAPISEPSPAQNFSVTTFGQVGDKPQPADFDGDGKTDKAIWRPSSAEWWIQKSSDNSVYSVAWGLETDILVSSAYFLD